MYKNILKLSYFWNKSRNGNFKYKWQYKLRTITPGQTHLGTKITLKFRNFHIHGGKCYKNQKKTWLHVSLSHKNVLISNTKLLTYYESLTSVPHGDTWTRKCLGTLIYMSENAMMNLNFTYNPQYVVNK